MIGSVLQIASSGMAAASKAAGISANNIVNATTPDFTAQAPVYSSLLTGGVAVFAQDTGAAPNPITEAISLIAAANQYKAAASLVPTGLDLNATLLQTVA